MGIEQVATLIWRFIGLAFVAMALPGILLQSATIMRSALSGAGQINSASPFVSAIAVLLILFGVALMRYSKPLGRLISHGL